MEDGSLTRKLWASFLKNGRMKEFLPSPLAQGGSFNGTTGKIVCALAARDGGTGARLMAEEVTPACGIGAEGWVWEVTLLVGTTCKNPAQREAPWK